MLKNVFKFSWLWVLVVSTTFFACSNDSSNLTETSEVVAEQQAVQALAVMQAGGNIGSHGCLELVFPVTIEFDDGTTEELNDLEELRAAIMEWKDSKPSPEEHPMFVFPIEVISEDGEVILVNNLEELKTLKQACGGPGHHKPGHGEGGCSSCFEILFPISIEFPDGTEVEYVDRTTLKTALMEWKQSNPDIDEHPQLVFPIEVELEDGIVLVNSKEELQELKESCGG